MNGYNSMDSAVLWNFKQRSQHRSNLLIATHRSDDGQIGYKQGGI